MKKLLLLISLLGGNFIWSNDVTGQTNISLETIACNEEYRSFFQEIIKTPEDNQYYAVIKEKLNGLEKDELLSTINFEDFIWSVSALFEFKQQNTLLKNINTLPELMSLSYTYYLMPKGFIKDMKHKIKHSSDDFIAMIKQGNFSVKLPFFDKAHELYKKLQKSELKNYGLEVISGAVDLCELQDSNKKRRMPLPDSAQQPPNKSQRPNHWTFYSETGRPAPDSPQQPPNKSQRPNHWIFHSEPGRPD